jgi:hypothetical protein
MYGEDRPINLATTWFPLEDCDKAPSSSVIRAKRRFKTTLRDFHGEMGSMKTGSVFCENPASVRNIYSL